jgi:predicted aconitase with swiveling domain
VYDEVIDTGSICAALPLSECEDSLLDESSEVKVQQALRI